MQVWILISISELAYWNQLFVEEEEPCAAGVWKGRGRGIRAREGEGKEPLRAFLLRAV